MGEFSFLEFLHGKRFAKMSTGPENAGVMRYTDEDVGNMIKLDEYARPEGSLYAEVMDNNPMNAPGQIGRNLKWMEAFYERTKDASKSAEAGANLWKKIFGGNKPKIDSTDKIINDGYLQNYTERTYYINDHYDYSKLIPLTK